MNVLNSKKSVFKLSAILLIVFSLFGLSTYAQQNKSMSISELEKLEDENMDYLKQVYKVVKDYPAFSYTYSMEDGQVQDVTVTGIDSDIERKRLEVILFDLKSKKNMLKNKANRVGVFYSVDEPAAYNGGRDELEREIRNNLEYPFDAKNWGVEGTIFVKFVVDANGEIPFATADSNIETSMEMYLEDLQEQAVSAVKATSGEWEPASVEGVEVASLAVVPVTFDIEKHPSLPALIR
jgi:hypothetical protein